MVTTTAMATAIVNERKIRMPPFSFRRKPERTDDINTLKAGTERNYSVLLNIERRLSNLHLRLADVQGKLDFLCFRLVMPEDFTVRFLSQERVFVMGKLVQLISYTVRFAAVPTESDAVKQIVLVNGEFVDVQHPQAVSEHVFQDRDAHELQVRVAHGLSGFPWPPTTVSLQYEDAAGLRSQPLVKTLEYRDLIAPEVPAEAIAIEQSQLEESVELPDGEIEPEVIGFDPSATIPAYPPGEGPVEPPAETATEEVQPKS
jgi:hypothetical protein